MNHHLVKKERLFIDMGSFIELNDTLRINKNQGFPKVLDYNKHIRKPFKASDFKGKIFEFKGKPSIRAYQQPPVRVFFVEEINGKWLYWGLVHIVEITQNYIKKITSGKFKIIHLYKPEEMKAMQDMVDRRSEVDFFKK